MSTFKRLLTAVGQFWWEFLVGENPDAFIGSLVIIGVALILRHDRAVAITVVLVLTLVVLLSSTYRSRMRSSKAD